MSIWYLTNDLMFSSRVVGTAQRGGLAVRLVPSPAALDGLLANESELPQRVLIDLEMPGLEIGALVARLRTVVPGIAILAYGPHVHVDKLAAAQATGCDHVLSNGEFHRLIATGAIFP